MRTCCTWRYAIVGDADALATWDEADLARPKLRRIVAVFARERGVRAPYMGTPPEVIKDWFGDSIR